MNKQLQFVEDFNDFSHDEDEDSPELDFISNGYDTIIQYRDDSILYDNQPYIKMMDEIEEKIRYLYKLKRNLNEFFYSIPKEEFEEKYGSIDEET